MRNYNLSDAIEAYIKDVLIDKNQVELKRQDIAHHFDCVPSQINYVIKTRFTIAKGYRVESKRGGGGYIRIQKVNQTNEKHIEYLLLQLPDKLTYADVEKLMNHLYEMKLISCREKELFLRIVTPEIISNHDNIRSVMTKEWLDCLRYDWEE